MGQIDSEREMQWTGEVGLGDAVDAVHATSLARLNAVGLAE